MGHFESDGVTSLLRFPGTYGEQQTSKERTKIKKGVHKGYSLVKLGINRKVV